MFCEINDFEMILFGNILTASQEDMQGDTRLRSSSPGTTGGPESKETSESILVDEKPVSEPNPIGKRLITLYIPTKSQMHHGNTFLLPSSANYRSQMALMPS